MTGLDLITMLREDFLDSPELDSLWSNAQLLRNLSSAEREIAIRTLCLSDSATAGIASIAAATAGWNALSPKILYIDDVLVAGTRLRFASGKTLEFICPDHETTVTGSPAYYLLDNHRIRFVPNTSAPAALLMTVKRLPLTAITATSTPEASEQYYPALLHYAAYLSYLLKDSQTLDKDAAATHLGIFSSMVGPEVSAKDQYDRKHKIVREPV